MDHHTEDAHLSGTAVEELLGAEVDHVGLVAGVGSETNGDGSTTHVTGKGTLLLLEHSEFENTADGKDGEDTVNSVDGRVADDGGVAAGEVLTSGEAVVIAVRGRISEGSHHSDTAVLDLNLAEAIEPLLVTIFHKVQRVPADGAVTEVSGADLVVKGTSDGGGNTAGLGGGKSSGRASHKGKSSNNTHGSDYVDTSTNSDEDGERRGVRYRATTATGRGTNEEPRIKKGEENRRRHAILKVQ